MTYSRPTSVPFWATGSGRRTEPDALELASGFVELTRTPAKKANWAVGYLSDWIVYLRQFTDIANELVYPVAKSRQVVIPGFLLRGLNWSPDGGAGSSNCATNNEAGALDLTASLPPGALLQQVYARGSAANASAAGLTLTVLRHHHVNATDETVGTANTGAGAGTFGTAVDCGNEEIDKATYSYRLVVNASSTAASGGVDILRSVRASLSAVGPRHV